MEASCIASFFKKEDQEKALMKILRETSISFYEKITNGITYEAVARDLGNTIKNVFICFQIDCKTDIHQGGLNFAETIGLFIKKLTEIISQNKNYMNNFFFLVCGTSAKNEPLPQFLKEQFSADNFFHLGRLPEVEKEDAYQWLETIKQRNSNIEEDTKTLFRLVFMGDNNFPSKYASCIKLINNRTN